MPEKLNPLKGPFDNSRNEEFLSDFIEDAGPVENQFATPLEMINKYQDRVPEIIVQLWQQNGLGSLQSGALWLCDPDDFRPTIEVLFAGDPDIDPTRTHTYGYSAFGKLFAWNEDHWDLEVDLVDGIVSCAGLLDETKKRNVNLNSISALEMLDGIEDIDEQDENGKRLYKRAKKKLGALEYRECYGFVPALALGGARDIEHLKRVRAPEHFLILAQLQEFALRDYLSSPIRDVRVIGG